MKLTKKIIGLMIIASLGGAVVGCSSNKEPEQGIVVPTPDKDESSKEEKLEEEKTGIDTPNIEQEEKPEAEKPVTKPEQKPEVEKPVTKPEQKPGAEKPATKPEQKPEAEKPATKPEQKPGAEKPATKPEQKPEAEKPITKPEQKPEEVPAMSASEVYDKVVTSNLDLPSFVEMDSNFFADTYGIDTSILKSYKVQTPMMIVHASEIAIFELKDINDISKVNEGINKRVEGLKAQWGSYLPDQLELVNNYKTTSKGNYVIFVVSEHADTIINNFNANVK